jgi:hypothetical protein
MAAQQIIQATVPAVTIAATADQVVGEAQSAGRVTAVAFDEKAATVTSTVVDKTLAAGDILVWVSTAVTGGGGLADPGGRVEVTIGASSYTDVASALGTVAQTES